MGQRTVTVAGEDFGGEIVRGADHGESLLLFRGVLSVRTAQQRLRDGKSYETRHIGAAGEREKEGKGYPLSFVHVDESLALLLVSRHWHVIAAAYDQQTVLGIRVEWTTRTIEAGATQSEVRQLDAPLFSDQQIVRLEDIIYKKY